MNIGDIVKLKTTYCGDLNCSPGVITDIKQGMVTIQCDNGTKLILSIKILEIHEYED